MSGNERIPDALSDFDTIVRSGGSIDQAVAEAARANDLKSEVVRHRAEKAFGDLKAYEQRCLQVAEVTSERREKLQPLADFIDVTYQKVWKHPFQFIPIGNFIRSNFPEGYQRDEAFAFSREHQKKWRQKNAEN